MKRTLPYFTALLITAPAVAQNWIVGTPVSFALSEVTIYGNGCYPGADMTFNFPVSAVDGIEHVAIVQAITPAGVNTVVPGPASPLIVGDTIFIDTAGPRACYFPNTGSMLLRFYAIGTPTTAGQAHPCNFNTIWISNLLLCPEGLSKGLSAGCTVQPGTVGVVHDQAIAQQLQLPSPANGNTLRILDASVRSAEVFNACGARMGSITAGALVCDWPEGVYIVRVVSVAGMRTERVVITR